MDVKEQSAEDWNVLQWRDYWNTPHDKRRGTYNVISLELSHTSMESKIVTPEAVRRVDWVRHWPQSLTRKEYQPEGKSQYPKVQHYLLMGVKNCFTDFHIDFGGSSVWYHIIRGHKIFLIAPPTKKNLAKYEEWISNPKQDETFFSSTLAPGSISRVEVKAGQTFFIPAGWIHAVFTKEDTIVVGGNFLHSYNIKTQLEVADIELRRKVPLRMRYPYFTATNWFALYFYSQLIQAEMGSRKEFVLNSWEREGLVCLVEWLEPHKVVANKALTEDGKALYRPQFLIDYVTCYLQSRPLPNEEDYKIQCPSLEHFSPLKKLPCTCGRHPDEDDEVWISCDYCGHWFHARCVFPEQSVEETATSPFFYCGKCTDLVTSASPEVLELLINFFSLSLHTPPSLLTYLPPLPKPALAMSLDDIPSTHVQNLKQEPSQDAMDVSPEASKKRKAPTPKPGGVYYNYGDMSKKPKLNEPTPANGGGSLSRSGSNLPTISRDRERSSSASYLNAPRSSGETRGREAPSAATAPPPKASHHSPPRLPQQISASSRQSLSPGSQAAPPQQWQTSSPSGPQSAPPQPRAAPAPPVGPTLPSTDLAHLLTDRHKQLPPVPPAAAQRQAQATAATPSQTPAYTPKPVEPAVVTRPVITVPPPVPPHVPSRLPPVPQQGANYGPPPGMKPPVIVGPPAPPPPPPGAPYHGHPVHHGIPPPHMPYPPPQAYPPPFYGQPVAPPFPPYPVDYGHYLPPYHAPPYPPAQAPVPYHYPPY